ncbi:MAG TPA: flagellar motor protein MotB [Lacipirellulaceae bacterium]|jgi:chemotaxis protein MotB|nr:flagellar motor protein MotB [Lacipirellulaceae bacterium]
MAGGGGAWKVAYADFVTAMMAFFMVMWLTAQSPEVKKAIGGYFQDPWGTSSENSTPTMQSPAGLSGNVPFADSASGILPNRWPQANQENATEKQPGAASVWQQKQKVFLMVSTDRNLPALVVNFDDSGADLSAASQQRLNDLMPALVGKQNKIELRAHSTRRPLPKESPFHDHWQLCYERGAATMSYLVKHGVEPDRIRLSQSGEYEPLTTRLESSWQDENNCVEVFLLTETSSKSPGTLPASTHTADATPVPKRKP